MFPWEKLYSFTIYIFPHLQFIIKSKNTPFRSEIELKSSLMRKNLENEMDV